MKKFAKKFALLSMASVLMAGSLVGCGSDTSNNNNSGNTTPATGDTGSSNNNDSTFAQGGTSVIAIGNLNGVFSAFFGTTAYDRYIYECAHEYLITVDREGRYIPNLADFTIEEITNDAGDLQTVYTFKLQEGITFSDGVPMTADDILFGFYVLLDPTYDGTSTLFTVDIVGLDEYRNGDATEVAGIQRIDDHTVSVTINGIDAGALNKFRVHVLPEHYYGETFVKGDLSGVKAKNGAPLGSGPFVFEDYSNNVVSFVANENYHKGTPNLEKLKFQVTDSANLFEAVRSEQVDISDPTASPDQVKMVEDARLHYELTEYNGYGYIGMNAERIPDINVRKGLMHLMNRGPAVQTYYGDLATVIERPMTTISWAYPQDAEEYYGYSPEKALEYFTLAGYENVGGKLMKDGEQLRIEVGISASGTMDHPSAPVLTQMKVDLENMGGVLEIMDTDGTVFFEVLNAEEWDMWVAAWTATPDPDLYQIYHSDGSTSRYNINNPELDKLIEDARTTNDVDVRTNLYHQALDIIMDEAINMPIYQRKNMYVINPEWIDINSLPENMTPYHTFYQALDNLAQPK
ncbi:MAG: hypothetical protein ATN36_07345 [Epulopiscium sp. Nele67-Bin005]|nr:MAG: hypothetical protein ATN36_07345 [Epulopiscium sp. Nele67-Bin005]